MPNFDRTGPWGQGPMTGWRAGLCAGFRPGAGKPRGGGLGRRQRGRGGFGRGRGTGGAYIIADEVPVAPTGIAPDETLSSDERRRALKAERNRLKTALASVEGELGRMGPPDKSSE